MIIKNLEPRLFARRFKTDSGVKVPNPNKQLVTPIEFGVERAKEIVAIAKAKTIGPWTDVVEELMTDGELVYVMVVWDFLSDSSTWNDAFNRILKGHIIDAETRKRGDEAYKQLYDALDENTSPWMFASNWKF